MTTDELRRIFRENVRLRRKSLGLTQQALAESIGVRQPTIAQLETGAISPTLDHIAKLAESLDIPPDTLFRAGIFSKIPA